MEKQGWVSIWLGNVNHESDMIDYVDVKYDDDYEPIPSKFFVDFGVDVDDVDEDFIEKMVYRKSSDNISILLSGCSYEEVIIPKVESISLSKSYNSIFLLYNFRYNGNVKSRGVLDFITAVEYE